MHVLIILNPTSGSAKPQTIYQMRQALLAAGAEVTLYTTTAAGDATRYLQNYSAPLDVVAVAGGDGTLNEVVNGLAGHPNDSFRLALIPMGTTNVLAYELGIKRKNAIATLLNGKEKLIYPSHLNGNRFLLMAGIGYDAWVVDRVNPNLKRRMGKLAYVVSMLKQLPNFGRKLYRLRIDGTSYSAYSAIITNGRFYGGSFLLSRQANLSTNTMQVLMLNGKHMGSLLLSLLGLPFGLMEKMPGVVSVPGQQIEVKMLNSVTQEPVQADGDIRGQLPATITMETSPLRVLVP